MKIGKYLINRQPIIGIVYKSIFYVKFLKLYLLNCLYLVWQKSGIIRLYDRFPSWQLKQWADSIYLTLRYSQCAFMRYNYSDTYTMIQIQYYVIGSVFRVASDTGPLFYFYSLLWNTNLEI